MSGFVFTDPVETDAPAPIAHDGWYPGVDPAQVKADQRVPASVTPERLREAIVAAMVTIGNQLGAWQRARQVEGRATLADVPASTIAGESRLVLLYRRAIGCEAKAELIERHRDLDITGAGDRRSDALDPAIGELRRAAIHAVRDMLGRGRTDIELI